MAIEKEEQKQNYNNYKLKATTTIYVYDRNKELVGTYKGYNTAAKETQSTVSTVWKICKNGLGYTKQGYTYRLQPISSEDEIPEYIPKQEKTPRRANDSCKVQYGKWQEFQVNCKDHQVYFLERSKKGRKQQLKQLIKKMCELRWITSSPLIARMERNFCMELIDSL